MQGSVGSGGRAARAARRDWPRSSARSRSISLPGPLANTLTGRILTMTSPGGRTMLGNLDQPPARLKSTPPHPATLATGYTQNFWNGAFSAPPRRKLRSLDDLDLGDTLPDR